MSCYGPLAVWYDRLTGDVPYGAFADHYEAEFARDGGEFRLLLDVCCGTGTLHVEAAYLQADRAPGLTRRFACESWPTFPAGEMVLAREKAKERFSPVFA